MERYRKVVMGARLIEVRGRVEFEDGVLHVIAAHLSDATDQLGRLSDDLLKPAIAHGDHAGPLPPGIPEHVRQGHPRDVRVIPKSRDFH
jgi:error-prone DNA polymerase